VAPIGLFLGRIANFINGELWGRTTDVAWAVVFPLAGPIARHPSQIYEAALEGLLLGLLLIIAVRQVALKRPWLVSGLFGIGYGLARIASEFFREPDQQLGFLLGGATMGMLLSVPLVLLGLALAAHALRKPPASTPPESPIA
jgi:phosphatidylglycerol:prolipoprotein diacylglycerol transferase